MELELIEKSSNIQHPVPGASAPIKNAGAHPIPPARSPHRGDVSPSDGHSLQDRKGGVLDGVKTITTRAGHGRRPGGARGTPGPAVLAGKGARYRHGGSGHVFALPLSRLTG